MTINYAKYVRPNLVLEDLNEAATTLANILQQETNLDREDCSLSGALHTALHEIAPRVAALAQLYLDATTPDGSPF